MTGRCCVVCGHRRVFAGTIACEIADEAAPRNRRKRSTQEYDDQRAPCPRLDEVVRHQESAPEIVTAAGRAAWYGGNRRGNADSGTMGSGGSSSTRKNTGDNGVPLGDLLGENADVGTRCDLLLL